MRPLSPAELLDAWERGISQPRPMRTLALLASADAASSVEAAAELSVGERDRRLLTLREWTFGSSLASVSACPECRERLEWEIDAATLGPFGPDDPADVLSLESGEYAIRFRLPNTLDLAVAAAAGTIAGARTVLLERCVTEATRTSEPIGVTDVPADVTDAVASRMADADRANVQIAIDCPACGHRWSVVFDIESYFWNELSAWAQRALSDVHTLARAYGWREADILRMGQWRRQFYLTLIGA